MNTLDDALEDAELPSEQFTVTLGRKEVTGTFSALPFMRWQELIASHPPRDGNSVDEGWGFCHSTFWPALVRASISEPKPTKAGLDKLMSLLTQGQVTRLGSQAFALNLQVHEDDAGDVDIPKSPDTSPETTSPKSD